jgi:hypothetical protein
MFTIRKEHCLSIEQQLLWNIQELLKKEAPLVLPKEETPVKVVESTLCELCGKDHANVGARLACARKQNKRGDVQK